jgi:hypothetical protein
MKKQNQKKQAAPEFSTDADGQQLVHVALANTDQRATLYAEDYQRLMAAGFSPYWNHTTDGAGNHYPVLSAYTAQGQNRTVTIARLISCAGAGKRVRCADGNTLNLCAENLKLEDAPVWRSAADWFPNVAALRAAGIAPVVRDKAEEKRGPRKLRSNGRARLAVIRHTPAVPTAPAQPRQPFTPRVVDVAALGQRARQQMAAQAVEVTP